MIKKLLFKQPKFIKSAVKQKDYPKLYDSSGVLLPEVAVAGRSNVGKSSLINNLFNVKGMAKTSATPGKTQLLNFFTVDDLLAFCDLPGYGYAKVSTEIRSEWGPMIENYLSQRTTLHLLLLLFDIRREPNEEDLQLLNWAQYYQKPVQLILTKVDKVSKQESQRNCQKINMLLGLDPKECLLYSSTKNIGRQQLIGLLKKVV